MLLADTKGGALIKDMKPGMVVNILAHFTHTEIVSISNH